MNTELQKRKSNINGTGIFTTQSIQSGAEFYAIPLDIIFNEPKPKCARIAEKKYVSDSKVLNWVNHSCAPNTKLDIMRSSPVLTALRNIAPDEEISVNYNETEVQGIKVKCTCKSENCKQYFIRL